MYKFIKWNIVSATALLKHSSGEISFSIPDVIKLTIFDK